MKAIDLFAGAGGFSLAALRQGCQILAAVELDKDACMTYRKNIIADSKDFIRLYEGDILQLDPKEILSELNLIEGELDLMIGGPPCQGFSTHRFKDQGVDDPRNKLLFRYFDFISVFRPKTFLVENVSGLLWERHKLYLSRFMKLAKKLGYDVRKPELVDAKNHGVPQNRRRVFILGIRDDINSSSIDWPPAVTHFSPDKDGQPWRTASTVFEPPSDEVLKKLNNILGENIVSSLEFGRPLKPISEDPCVINMEHSEDLTRRFADTPLNGSRRDTPHTLKCHQNYEGHWDVYGRVKLAQPGATITTGCNNPSKGRFLHPWKNHGISLRHAARFQTFPDEFIFYGGSISQARQIGNAVPVLLGEKMIQTCKKIIRKVEADRIDSEIKQA